MRMANAHLSDQVPYGAVPASTDVCAVEPVRGGVDLVCEAEFRSELAQNVDAVAFVVDRLVVSLIEYHERRLLSDTKQITKKDSSTPRHWPANHRFTGNKMWRHVGDTPSL